MSDYFFFFPEQLNIFTQQSLRAAPLSIEGVFHSKYHKYDHGHV